MISIGSDHAGLVLKKTVVTFLKNSCIPYMDHGPEKEEPVDFPDYAAQVCTAILDGKSSRGILICGTGIGMSIAANKFPGIRAALCTSIYQARMSRLHNDANVLVLAARITAVEFALEIVQEWLTNHFLGGKYKMRNDKIISIEQFLSGGNIHDI